MRSLKEAFITKKNIGNIEILNHGLYIVIPDGDNPLTSKYESYEQGSKDGYWYYIFNYDELKAIFNEYKHWIDVCVFQYNGIMSKEAIERYFSGHELYSDFGEKLTLEDTKKIDVSKIKDL